MRITTKQCIIKHCILLVLCCSPNFLFTQITDHFADNDFLHNPIWMGTNENFLINENQQLQLYANETAVSYLSLQSEYSADCEWQFWIKLAFSPSANNFARLYLMSDNPNLNEVQQGYFIQFGEAGSNDAIELFRQEGEDVFSICRSEESLISSSFEMRIKVLRDTLGNWEIYSDPGGGYYFQTVANGNDNMFQNSSFFGLYCKNTSSNATKMYFDDFYIGPTQTDSIPPVLTAFSVTSDTTLSLEFSEMITPESMTMVENYFINNAIENPKIVVSNEDFNTADLIVNSLFMSGVEYIIEIKNLSDLSGNTLSDTSIVFKYYAPEFNDIVINEILFDPLLDCAEYIELYNRSYQTINLKQLSFFIIKNSFPNPSDTTFVKICEETFHMVPKSYLALSKEPGSLFEFFTIRDDDAILECENLPSLINSGAEIGISNSKKEIIDIVAYSEDMHYPLLNFTDGVALERVHFNRPSYENSNWQSASFSSGFGTPGYQNSQFTLTEEVNENISIIQEIFTPDNDGIDDLLIIQTKWEKLGTVVNIQIFNAYGSMVRYLVKNELCGSERQFSWDGLDENHQILPIGHYILFIETFDQNGNQNQYKKPFVLGRKF